jgi:small subunit ribosomal protein S8
MDTNNFADLIIRIKNGYLSKKEAVFCRQSNFNLNILKKLKELKLIKDFKETSDKKTVLIELLYHNNNEPALTDVKIQSRPGKRIYRSYKDLKPVLSGLGFSIISTPKGILTNKEARKLKVGGEVLFDIW